MGIFSQNNTTKNNVFILCIVLIVKTQEKYQGEQNTNHKVTLYETILQNGNPKTE